MKTTHQQRIEQFMQQAGQDLPTRPMIPCQSTRFLRANLILEEALETIEALGFTVTCEAGQVSVDRVVYIPDRQPDLIQIADGCADLSVVTIGTLSACGIDDNNLLKEINDSNNRKFAPGSYRRADGKWIKPPDWKKPDIEKVLEEQKEY